MYEKKVCQRGQTNMLSLLTLRVPWKGSIHPSIHPSIHWSKVSGEGDLQRYAWPESSGLDMLNRPTAHCAMSRD